MIDIGPLTVTDADNPDRPETEQGEQADQDNQNKQNNRSNPPAAPDESRKITDLSFSAAHFMIDYADGQARIALSKNIHDRIHHKIRYPFYIEDCVNDIGLDEYGNMQEEASESTILAGYLNLLITKETLPFFDVIYFYATTTQAPHDYFLLTIQTDLTDIEIPIVSIASASRLKIRFVSGSGAINKPIDPPMALANAFDPSFRASFMIDQAGRVLVFE